MKTLYLSCIMSLACVNAFTQTYSAFNKDRPAYYQFANSYDIFYTQAAISIDSFKVLGTDTIFYHYPIIDAENDPCYLKAHDSSFVNTESHRLQNGDDIFFNRNHDTLLFNNSAMQNESWIMYHFANGDLIKATIQSIDQISVLGINDSVKTVTLQAQNSSGNNSSHIFNGKKYLIGKNTGLVSGYSMFHFPIDTIPFSLIGIENPSSGLNMSGLSPQNVFDFNVGDEFDYKGGSLTAPAYHSNSYTSRKILSKQVSANGDTIKYSIEGKSFNQNWYIYDYSEYYGEGVGEEKFVISEFSFLNSKPGAWAPFINSEMEGGVPTLIPAIYSTSGTTKSFFHNYYIEEDDCLTDIVWGIGPGYREFSAGLGETSIFYGQFNWNFYEALVYFKKGNTEWGDSINWDVVTGIKNANHTVQYNVYPNPTRDFIFIEGVCNPAQSEYKIFNSHGKEMPLKNISFGNQSIRLDLTALSAGVYFLTIKNENQIFTSKFMKP